MRDYGFSINIERFFHLFLLVKVILISMTLKQDQIIYWNERIVFIYK